MNKEKWSEYAKEVTPIMESLSDLHAKYNINPTIIACPDGFLMACFVEEKKLYDLVRHPGSENLTVRIYDRIGEEITEECQEQIFASRK